MRQASASWKVTANILQPHDPEIQHQSTPEVEQFFVTGVFEMMSHD